MRIESRSISANTSAGGATRAQGAGARFVLPETSQPAQGATASAIGALANLDAMIALQSAEHPTERRKRAAKRGHQLLDELESLKIAVLSGRVSPAQLQRLMSQLKAERHAGGDPQLDDVISLIELRAAVELAKMGIREV